MPDSYSRIAWQIASGYPALSQAEKQDLAFKIDEAIALAIAHRQAMDAEPKIASR